ncbi:MAG: hypothetical protein IPH07_39695 [Deltaproteobacteria bacterium]|nr:hypothetical protein [Deltaproteobacteria bacterium]MBP7291742.1 hypothetical protein [Nannocystaceae bacterium]
MGWNFRSFGVVTMVLCGCADDTGVTGGGSEGSSHGGGSGSSTGGSDGSTGGTSTGGSTTATSQADSSSGPSVKYDVGVGDSSTGEVVPFDCKAVDPMGEVMPCQQQAPADSFEPDVQWEWLGADGLTQVVTSPLVVNLTDDNADDEIDLCDIPDVVVVAFDVGLSTGRIFVLAGDTGIEHFSIPTSVDLTVTPAVGDIDDDGIAEIVTIDGQSIFGGGIGHLVAFEHDGTIAWTSPDPAGDVAFTGVALADLDADGDVEILAGDAVYDHLGGQLWTHPEAPLPGGVGSLPTAADLDGDGTLEVIHGRNAYAVDGSVFYSTGLLPGFPHVASFDADPEPEIILMNPSGITMLEADGTIVWQDQRPTGDPPSPETVWLKPGTVHDFDGDGASEFATGSANNYTVYEIDDAGPTILWQAPVQDLSGSAGGTAFDFDGNGIAEAMYADETQLFVFDGSGDPLFTTPRESGTGLEYPVVADIDNDGAAEILVVSNFQTLPNSPAVVAIRDVQERWIQARRIWNQHTYHVSNVREDGTIPQHETPSWQQLNTFRTNSQIEGGSVCQPAG